MNFESFLWPNSLKSLYLLAGGKGEHFYSQKSYITFEISYIIHTFESIRHLIKKLHRDSQIFRLTHLPQMHNPMPDWYSSTYLTLS